MRPILALVILALPLVTCAAAWSGSNPNAALALDIALHTKVRSCTPSYSGCHSIHSSYSGTGSIDVMVVVHDYSNLKGVEYTVQWPSAWSFDGFVSCADLQITSTVGDSILNVSQTWITTTVAASDSSGIAVGWLKFSDTTTGQLKLKTNTASGFRGVVDTLYVLDAITTDFTGQVGSSSGGDDPCP